MTIANFSNFHHSFTPLIFITLNRGKIFLVGQLSGYCFEVIYFLLLNTFWIFWMFVYAFDLANKKTRNNKTDRFRSWIDTQSSYLGFTTFNVLPCSFPKTTDKLLLQNLYHFMYDIEKTSVYRSTLQTIIYEICAL